MHNKTKICTKPQHTIGSTLNNRSKAFFNQIKLADNIKLTSMVSIYLRIFIMRMVNGGSGGTARKRRLDEARIALIGAQEWHR